MKGPLLAATFSFGCEMANELGFTPTLKEYAFSCGKSSSEEEIRRILKELASYLYYLVIAESNGISDPFDFQVVKAHWIGNGLLEKVAPKYIKIAIGKERKKRDLIPMLYLLRPLIETGKAHHNFYARQIGKDGCKVAAREGYLWHLGQKRIQASPEDLKNLAKYG